MKVWYLQVIWLVRNSTKKKHTIAGKIMIKWQKTSGKKDQNNKLRVLKESNLLKIKKLPMLFQVLALRILKLMFLKTLTFQRRQQRHQKQKMVKRVLKKPRLMMVLLKQKVVMLLQAVSQIFQSLILTRLLKLKLLRRRK